MGRYDYLASDSSLRTTLDCRNVDDLKKLVALLPGVTMKAPRKGELIAALENFLLGGEVVQLWTQLEALEQFAVSEVVYSDGGSFDAGVFHAKYGALPVFEIEQQDHWSRRPTLLRLFIHPKAAGGLSVPDDLREKLRAFVPKPTASELASFDQISERPPRQWTYHRFDIEKGDTVSEQSELPLIVRLT